MQVSKALQPPVVLFHGLLSSAQEFSLLNLPLRGRGITLHTPDIPGYTGATGARQYDWRVWRDSARATLAGLGADRQPMVVGGLCTGGILAACAALQENWPIAGLVLMAPTFRYDGWGLGLVRHLRHIGYWSGLDRFFSVTEREPYGVKNPKLRHWIRNEMLVRNSTALGPQRLPLSAVREAERMTRILIALLMEKPVPLLMIHAREDEITRLDSVLDVFGRLPGPDKQLLVLEDSYHMITIDNERHVVAQALAAFLQRIGAAQAHTAEFSYSHSPRGIA